MSRKKPVSSSINFVSTVVYVSFLLNLAIAAKPKGFSIKMIRSDSKESPLYPTYANLTQAERLRGLVEQSKARVRHLGSARAAAYNQTSSMNPNIVPLKYLEGRSVHVGEVGFGTFGNNDYKKFYLVIDTGSDLTWTQCSGGLNYFYQNRPFYDKEHSDSYKRVPCDHLRRLCNGERCKDGFCKYQVSYGSGQVTSGDLAYELLSTQTLNVRKHRDSFVNTVMGCGLDQLNFGKAFGVPETHDGAKTWLGTTSRPGTALIAGILGLGQGDSALSFVLRLAGHTGKRFEYCLAPYNRADASPTYLRFGSETIIGQGPEVITTTIYQDPNLKTHYYLELMGISVNHKKLEFTQRDFQKRDGRGGTIIDSGTPYSSMMSRFYGRVEEELIHYFKGLDIPTVRGEIGLQTCFRIPDNFQDFPTMRFHFDGGAFIIGGSSMFVTHKDTLCLAIFSDPDDQAYFAVNIGAMQQSNKRISYDIGKKKLSFREEDCRLSS